MRFWWRELMGWVLILAGLSGMGLCVYVLLFLSLPDFVTAFLLTLPSIMVFRGGIHLLKVAVAARIALHAHAEEVKQSRPRPPTPSATGRDW